LNGLATLAGQQGQDEQALALYRRALVIRQEHLDSSHPDIAETLHDLASFLQQRHQNTEALSRYQQALAIRERALGNEHPQTQETRTALEQLIEQMRLAQQAEDAMVTETTTPEPKQDVQCACGCGRMIESSKGRGKPRRFFSGACKQRFYRNTLQQKRNADSV
jgi:tetratricopeptide (TPR) repeat protein